MANIYEPSTAPMDETRCKAGVWRYFSSNANSYGQCEKKAKLDGWCNVHHPDAENLRAKASREKYDRSVRREAMGWYGERFLAALVKIRDGHNDPRALAAEALEGCKYAPAPEPTNGE